MRVLHLAFREASYILAVAVLLGFIYNALTQKGFFRSSATPVPYRETQKSISPPEMISLDEASALFASGGAVFIDTRDEFLFRAGHIQGAVHVPLEELDSKMEGLKKLSLEKALVTYCDGTRCHSSIEFSNRLFAARISKVKVFFGGWEEWTAARLPTETSMP